MLEQKYYTKHGYKASQMTKIPIYCGVSSDIKKLRYIKITMNTIVLINILLVNFISRGTNMRLVSMKILYKRYM